MCMENKKEPRHAFSYPYMIWVIGCLAACVGLSVKKNDNKYTLMVPILANFFDKAVDMWVLASVTNLAEIYDALFDTLQEGTDLPGLSGFLTFVYDHSVSMWVKMGGYLPWRFTELVDHVPSWRRSTELADDVPSKENKTKTALAIRMAIERYSQWNPEIEDPDVTSDWLLAMYKE